MKPNVFWLRLTGSVLLLGWIVSVLDWSAMFTQLRSVSLPWFLLALAVNGLATVVARAMLIWSLLDRSTRPALGQVIEVFFTLRFYSMALPKPVVVGLRISRLSRLFGRDAYYAIGLMSYEGLTGALCMASGAVVCYLAVADQVPWSPLSAYVFASAAGLLLLFFALFTNRLDGLVERLLRAPLLPGALRERLRGFLQSWRQWVLQHILRDRHALLSSAGFALVFYLGFVGSGYVLFLAMGETLGFAEIAWSRSSVWLLTVLPFSVGGLGVREAGLAYVMADFGVDFELAVAYGFLSFILQSALGLVGGMLELKNAVLRR